MRVLNSYCNSAVLDNATKYYNLTSNWMPEGRKGRNSNVFRANEAAQDRLAHFPDSARAAGVETLDSVARTIVIFVTTALLYRGYYVQPYAPLPTSRGRCSRPAGIWDRNRSGGVV